MEISIVRPVGTGSAADLEDVVERAPVRPEERRRGHKRRVADSEEGRFWALVMENDLESPAPLGSIVGQQMTAGLAEVSWTYNASIGQ